MTIVKLEMVKQSAALAEPIGDWNLNDAGNKIDNLPAYAYIVKLSGITDLDFDDRFDASVLQLYTGSDVGVRVFSDHLCAASATVVGVLANNDYGYASKSITPTALENNTGLHFHMDQADLPKQANGESYPYYYVCYILKVKDAATKAQLDAEAMAAEGGKIQLSNTASMAGASGATVNVDYKYEPLSKTATQINDGSDGTRANIKWQVKVNPSAVDCDPDSDEITVVDNWSSTLVFDYQSVQVSPESALVKYTTSGNSATFTLKDETPVTITYTSYVNGKDTVTYTNTATVLGYTDGVQDATVTLKSQGGGTASVPSIKVMKMDYDDNRVTLEGATFGLWYLDNGTWVTYPPAPKEQAVFTTGADGSVYVIGNQTTDGWTLVKSTANQTYYYGLKEITAPEGYQLSETMYRFAIGDVANFEDGNYIYIPEVPMTIKNKKIVTAPVSLSLHVEKAVSGLPNGVSSPNFTFKLTPVKDAPKPANDVTQVSVPDRGKQNFGELTFTQAGTYTYTIVEEDIKRDHYFCDTTPRTVEVEVAPNEKGDQLVITSVKVNGTEVEVTGDVNAAATVKVTNTYYSVHLRKYSSDGTELGGAVMALLDSSRNPVTDALGNEVKITIAADQDADITPYVIPGNNYILQETKAPDGGYLTVQDIIFKVNTDGSVELKQHGVNQAAVAVVNNVPVIKVYDGAKAKLTLKGRKIVKKMSDITLDGITFRIYGTQIDENGAVVKNGITFEQTIDAGSITSYKDFEFPEIEFDHAGDYYFMIREEGPAETKAGQVYSSEVYYVKVQVVVDE